MTPCGNQVTLQPGDYIATEGLTVADYHAVAAAFHTAGAIQFGDSDKRIDYSFVGWHNGKFQGLGGQLEPRDGDRQLTLSQILSATNAGNNTTEPKTEAAPMHLADQLEAALMALDNAQSEVDRLQAEYRAAYPKIHGEVVLSEDMSDPSNWRAGDVVECVNHGGLIGSTEGREYTLEIDPNDGELSYRDDDGDWCNLNPRSAYRFVRRP